MTFPAQPNEEEAVPFRRTRTTATTCPDPEMVAVRRLADKSKVDGVINLAKADNLAKRLDEVSKMNNWTALILDSIQRGAA